MVLAEDIIFAVRDLLDNDKGNLNFSPASRYAVQKLIDYAREEHCARVVISTQLDVQRAKDTATADACRVTLAIFFTALLDKEGMEAEQLQRIWREVESLSESVRDGYVSAPDLIRVLREEYEIDIIGG